MPTDKSDLWSFDDGKRLRPFGLTATAGRSCVLVEANIGWIPTLLEQIDDMFLRYRFFTKAADAP